MPKLTISRDEWLEAASWGNLDKLNAWMKSGALDVKYDPVSVGVSGRQGRARIFDVCSTDKHNALYVAINSHQVDYAQRLLDIGKFPSTKTTEGRTAMHAAALLRERAEEVIPRLVEQGYAVDVEDNKGQTPLLDTISRKLPSSVQALLTVGASPNPLRQGRSPLVRAVGNQQVEIVKSLLESGAEPNSPDVKSGSDSALHWLAAAWDHSDDKDDGSVANQILRILVYAGANPDALMEESNGKRVNVWDVFYTEAGREKLRGLMAEKLAQDLDAATIGSTAPPRSSPRL